MELESQDHTSWLCDLREDTETLGCQVLNLQKGVVLCCKVFLKFEQDTEYEMLILALAQIFYGSY